MRQTGLTAGNLSSHTSKKIEAARHTEVAGGVCGQKAAYDAPADRCGKRGFSGVSGGYDAGASMTCSEPSGVTSIYQSEQTG